MSIIRTLLRGLQLWARRRKFREGEVLSRFIAPDVRRDIQIVSVARIDEGYVQCRVRTMNVLYLSRKLVPEPDFEPTTELPIDELWRWSGQSWGGLPAA